MLSAAGRAFFLVSGLLCLGLGILGVFLPLLPSTPFVLLAAFCFSRSSPRLHAWLLSRPRLGPLVRDWQDHGVIRPGAKILSTVMMAALMSYPLFFRPLHPAAKAGIVAVFLGVTAFVWSRRSRPDGKEPVSFRTGREPSADP